MSNIEEIAKSVQTNGFFKKDNWLSARDEEEARKIVLSLKPNKGDKSSWVAHKISTNLIKLCKLDFKALNRSYFFLKLANKLKLAHNSSEHNFLINRSETLLNESEKKRDIKNFQLSYPLSIFIVGMPRSGTTLIESILSLNKAVKDLGEIKILEKAYIKSRKFNQKMSLTDLYMQEINHHEQFWLNILFII